MARQDIKIKIEKLPTGQLRSLSSFIVQFIFSSEHNDGEETKEKFLAP